MVIENEIKQILVENHLAAVRGVVPYWYARKKEDDGLFYIEVIKRIDDTTSVSLFKSIDVKEIDKSWQDHFEKQKPIVIYPNEEN